MEIVGSHTTALEGFNRMDAQIVHQLREKARMYQQQIESALYPDKVDELAARMCDCQLAADEIESDLASSPCPL